MVIAHEKCEKEKKKVIPEYIDKYLVGGCTRIKNDKPQSIISKENHPRTQLTGVKLDLYNPVQSTLRRYDIENVQGIINNENSRKTLPLGLVKLPSFSHYKFEPPQIICPGYDLLPLSHFTLCQENTADELISFINDDMSDSWKKFINNLPMSKTRIHILKHK